MFAPLVRGGNRPLPLMVLELAGLLGLAALAWSHERDARRTGMPQTLWWAVALLILAPLVQMIPLPAALWTMLPGHEPYAQTLEIAGAAGMRPMSLHAHATQYAWLALIPCIAIFLLVQHLDRRQVRRLALLLVAMAALEATLGILQAGSGPGSPVHLGNPYGAGSATGTYVNKNHFAALMAMALPMLLAVWALEILPARDRRGEAMREHPRHADVKLAMRIGLSILLVLLLAALLFTRSRAGIGAGLLVFALASVLLFWSAATLRTRVVLAVVAAAALLLAGYLGLTPIVERFAPEELALSYEGRMRIAMATLRAGLDFLPLGSGLGTFADAFRRYQGERLTGFIDHAHNDYAEAFLELGVVGLAVIALFGLAYALRWRQLGRERLSRSLGYFQFAAGLGMLAMIVHAAFDFNFHIPANAIYFSFLAGVFFYDPPPMEPVTPAADRA